MDAPDVDLEEFARVQLGYEITTMVAQVELLLTFAPLFPIPIYLALVEAPLVHLRLLDDFFGSAQPRKDDVIARHYLDKWDACHFLDDDPGDVDLRSAINAQLQHPAARRESGYKWNFSRMLTLCQVAVSQFVVDLGRSDSPERAEWFAPVDDALSAFVERFGDYEVGHGS